MSQTSCGLWNPEFIIMLVYGIPAVPMNFLVFFIILWRRHIFNSSFFKIYLARSAVDIFVYFNKFITVRLPLYTCGTCILAGFFKTAESYFLTLSYWLHWHTGYIQYLLSLILAIDRFVVLIGNGGYKKYWKMVYIYIIIASFILPVALSYSILFGTTSFTYLNDTDNYMIDSTQDYIPLYDSVSAVMVACSVISILLNCTVIIMFWKGYVKLSHRSRRIEFNLCINSFVEATALSVTAAATILQRVLTPYPAAYKFTRVFLIFGLDAVALLPPFILLLTSHILRRHLHVPVIRMVFKRSTAKTVQKTNSASALASRT